MFCFINERVVCPKREIDTSGDLTGTGTPGSFVIFRAFRVFRVFSRKNGTKVLAQKSLALSVCDTLVLFYCWVKVEIGAITAVFAAVWSPSLVLFSYCYLLLPGCSTATLLPAFSAVCVIFKGADKLNCAGYTPLDPRYGFQSRRSCA
jgi:hypothetical protein